MLRELSRWNFAASIAGGAQTAIPPLTQAVTCRTFLRLGYRHENLDESHYRLRLPCGLFDSRVVPHRGWFKEFVDKSSPRRYTICNSMCFPAGSRLTMRKLRICPARASSGFDPAPAALPFQRACSMEVSAERSVVAPAGLCSRAVSAGSLHVP